MTSSKLCKNCGELQQDHRKDKWCYTVQERHQTFTPEDDVKIKCICGLPYDICYCACPKCKKHQSESREDGVSKNNSSPDTNNPKSLSDKRITGGTTYPEYTYYQDDDLKETLKKVIDERLEIIKRVIKLYPHKKGDELANEIHYSLLSKDKQEFGEDLI